MDGDFFSSVCITFFMPRIAFPSLQQWVARLIRHRRFLLKYTFLGLTLGLLVALCLPKEYEARMLTAAESLAIPDDEVLGGFTAENISAKSPASYDALRPSLYPQIFASVPFLDSLSAILVQTADGTPDSPLTLREYLEQRQHSLFPSSPDAVLEELRDRISILPDEKTRTVALACRMQDPLIAATVLDTLSRRIRAYITDYRTRKEREDLSLAQKLQQEARAAYFSAQEAQAAFEDRNRDLSRNNARKELTRLRVKTAFAKEEYTRATLRVHAAETRVIRVRPVFAVIEPPTVPVRPVSPSKLKYMLGFGLLGLLVGVWRIRFPTLLPAGHKKERARRTSS